MKAKASKRTRRTRPIRNSQLASKRNAAAAAAKKASLPIVTTGPKPQQPQVAEKIMVSGLPTDVNEAQIKVCTAFVKSMVVILILMWLL